MVRQEVLTSFIDNTIGELRNRYTMKRLQSPVFPVIKAPVDFNSLPPSLCSVLPVDFFEIDSLSEEVKIFESSRECKDRQFMMKIYELANTICQRLLKYEESPVSFNFERQAPAIFLADTGKDLKLHREGLKRELLRFGYDVYPQNPLPEHYDDMVHSIREDLRRCCLSIHLMGEDFGPVVTGSNYSIVELQNQVAADYCNELMEDPNATAFNRIVWVPQHTRHISFKQQNYLMTLKKDVRSILNTEFLQTPVEEFKSFVKKKLKQATQFDFAYEPENDLFRNKSIYLIYDRNEFHKCIPLANFLDKQGFNVILSVFDGNLMDIRNIHQDNLKNCDATIIYYGNDNEDWMRSKIQDLSKSLGLGRNKPITPQAILVDDPNKVARTPVDDREAMILVNQEEFSPDLLKPFLAKLETSN